MQPTQASLWLRPPVNPRLLPSAHGHPAGPH
jgi:hypothetical protein